MTTTNGKLDAADLDELRVKVAQLEQALSSRIIIEQAKGVLAERLATSIDDAFQLLRRAARSNRTNLHDLAARVVNEPDTPKEITATIERPPAHSTQPPTRPLPSHPGKATARVAETRRE